MTSAGGWLIYFSHLTASVAVTPTVGTNADYFLQSCVDLFKFSIWRVTVSVKGSFPLLSLSLVSNTGTHWCVYPWSYQSSDCTLKLPKQWLHASENIHKEDRVSRSCWVARARLELFILLSRPLWAPGLLAMGHCVWLSVMFKKERIVVSGCPALLFYQFCYIPSLASRRKIWHQS